MQVSNMLSKDQILMLCCCVSLCLFTGFMHDIIVLLVRRWRKKQWTKKKQ